MGRTSDRRITQLTRLTSGSISNVVPAPDSQMYAFVAFGDEGGGPGIYTINEDGTRMTRVNAPPAADAGAATPRRGRGRGGFGGGFAEPQWNKDGRSLYYLQGGGIYSVAISGGGGGATASKPPAAGGFGRRGRGLGRGAAAAADSTAANSSTATRVNFVVRIEIDRAAERRQVFQEAWRTMKNRFYDKNMHAPTGPRPRRLTKTSARCRRHGRTAQRYHGDDWRDQCLPHRYISGARHAHRSRAKAHRRRAIQPGF